MWKTTFKTAPSAGMSFFQDNISGVDRVGPILGAVLTTLKSSAAGSLLAPFAIDFTLINMFYAPNQISLGYIEDAPPFVTQDAGIAFTFALKPIKGKSKFTWPTLEDSRGRGLVIWGDSRTKFATVYVPRTELAKTQATTLLEPVLRVLYNIVGAATKNLLRNGMVLETECDPQYFHVYANRAYAATTLSQIVDNVPVSEWIMVPKVWAEYSYLIWQRDLPIMFPLYWSLYLDDDVYRFGIGDRARALIESSVTQFLAPAVALLAVAVKNLAAPIRPAPELVALITRMRAVQGVPIDEKRYAESERYVTLFLVRVIAGCANTPSLQQGLLDTIAQMRNVEAAECLTQGLVTLPAMKTLLQLIEAAYNAGN